MHYKLVLVNTFQGLDQKSWQLQLPATIGRSSDHEVSINHDSISRTHCRLSLNGEGALVIRDLNSMNGTYVHDERVTQSILMPGETFQLGAITLRIEYTSDTDPGKPRQQAAATADHSATVPMLPISKTPPPTESDAAPAPKKWWPFK